MTSTGESWHTPQEYLRKPSTIKAMQWIGSNYDEISSWTNSGPLRTVHLKRMKNTRFALRLWTEASKAWNTLQAGDYVAQDQLGFYPIAREVFEQNYQRHE